jgi:hypothetical protein
VNRYEIDPTYRVSSLIAAVRIADVLVEVMPLRTNRGQTVEIGINGQLIRVGPLPRSQPNCRDEVISALEELIEQHGDRSFTAREVYEQMLERGTSYAELTVCAAMQRMKKADPRRPDVKLERTGKSGLALVRVVAV